MSNEKYAFLLLLSIYVKVYIEKQSADDKHTNLPSMLDKFACFVVC